MHSLLIFGALLHATVLAVIGFFVLFAADRASGRTQTIGIATGRILGGGWIGHHHGMMGGYRQGWVPPAVPPQQPAAQEAAPANAQAPAAK